MVAIHRQVGSSIGGISKVIEKNIVFFPKGFEQGDLPLVL